MRRTLIATLLMMLSFIGTSAAFASTARPAVKHGGTLNILGIGSHWASLDPIYGSAIQASGGPYNLAYQTLFNFSSTGQLQPYLATSYNYNKTSTVLKIFLRHGVKFQDGTPMNARAVQFNLQRTGNPAGGSTCVPLFNNVTSVSTVGNYEVVMNFNPPYSAMVNDLAGNECTEIVSPTAVQSEGAQFGNEPVGTSPWKWNPTGSVTGQIINFTSWPGSWQKPLLNAVTFTGLASDQAVVQAVQANTAQLMVASPQDVVLARSAGLKVLKGVNTSLDYLRLNETSPPFNNLAARRALAAATNSPLIVRQLFQNQLSADQSLESPISPYFNGYRVAGFPQYSLANAAADVAALPGGKLNFTLTIESTPIAQSVGDALAAEWQQVPGITVTLNTVSIVTLLSDQHARTYQTLYAAGFGALPDPDNTYYRQLFSTSSNNQEGFVSPAFDSLSSQARETSNVANRKKLYIEAQKIIAQQIPILPLWSYANIWVYNKHVHNVPIPVSELNMDLTGIWLS